jgi:hypothetical protein
MASLTRQPNIYIEYRNETTIYKSISFLKFLPLFSIPNVAEGRRCMSTVHENSMSAVAPLLDNCLMH